MTRSTCLLILSTALAACSQEVSKPEISTKTAEAAVETSTKISAGYGEIEVFGSDNPFVDGAEIKDLGGDYGWSEGPVWIAEEGGYVLFTDVPGNAIHKYDPATGELSEWMKPAGADPVADYTSSPGANGLLAYKTGEILVPDHGNRALYSLDLATKEKTVLADRYAGKRFNSPNDVVVHDNGALFFTDPPYGLKGQDESEAKELDFNGVFQRAPDGTLSIVDHTLTRPNGIALSPDQRTLYVANSDPKAASFNRYPISADGVVGRKDRILDVTKPLAEAGFGNPDGMVVASDGTIFATGPGGLYVLSPEFNVLARLNMSKPCANATFGGNAGSTLYLTCYDRLVSVETNRTGF